MTDETFPTESAMPPNESDFPVYDEVPSEIVQAELPTDSYDASVATEDEPATSEGCCS